MNIKTAKNLDIVDYLASLGHYPTRKSHPDYWYKSPLRDEKTASFKVNRKRNTWKDFATNAGGNLVDFGIQYFRCPISEFLRRLGESGQTHPRQHAPTLSDCPEDEEKKKIKILSIGHIVSLPLIRYYRERRIADTVAKNYLQEAVYELNGKNYYALAFANDKGGYELRNKYFKGSSSPKESTYIDNGVNILSVFEGNFNFLSYLTIFSRQQQQRMNYLILNSTSFFELKLPLMLRHAKNHLFLDNDTIGQKCSQLGLELDKEKFIDHRSLYKGYNDLNDWHMQMGKSPTLSMRQTP